MKFGVRSFRGVVCSNIILSSLILLWVGWGVCYRSWRVEQALLVKRAYWQVQALSISQAPKFMVITVAELFTLMDTEPLCSLQVLNVYEDDAQVTHIHVSGPLVSLQRLITTLAASTVVSAHLVRTRENYELVLELKNLCLASAYGNESFTPKVVGQIIYHRHHYCVIEDAVRHIQLREQSQC